MKYRITLDIKNPLESEDHKLHVQAKHEYMDECSLIFLEEIFLTILRSCKKADKKAFYDAMSRFVVDDYESAKSYVESLEKERRHEN